MAGMQALKPNNQNRNKKKPKKLYFMTQNGSPVRSGSRGPQDTAAEPQHPADFRAGPDLQDQKDHFQGQSAPKNSRSVPKWSNKLNAGRDLGNGSNSNSTPLSSGPGSRRAAGGDHNLEQSQPVQHEQNPTPSTTAYGRAARFKKNGTNPSRRDQRPRARLMASNNDKNFQNPKDTSYKKDARGPHSAPHGAPPHGAPHSVPHGSPHSVPHSAPHGAPKHPNGPNNALQHFKGPRSGPPQHSKGPQGTKLPPNKKGASQKVNILNKEHQTSRRDQRPNKRKREDQDPKPKEVLNRVTYEEDGPLRFISQVGQGTYGKVYKAMDKTTSQLVAMKRLRLETQHEGFPVTAAREIKLLQVLDHPNIVRLSEIVVSRNDIYMALDYIEHDLAGLLLNNELEISTANTKSIMKQMLTALAFLHSQHILHRDIKGSNLLVTADGTVKIADFGLARYMVNAKSTVRYTNRVITLWYRPPELLMGAEHYGPEVDNWGAGCLLVEIFNRAPLFYGKDEVSQIQAIYSIMGVPTSEDWPEYTKLPWYHMISSLPLTGSAPAKKLQRVFSGSNVTPACFDLASKLLSMNPAHRLLAADALQHKYFSEEPEAQPLALHSQREWHDWEAKKRKRSGEEPEKT